MTSDKFRIFILLMYKNFLIRKRHWIQSLLLQIILPIGLLMFGQIPRIYDRLPDFISNNTYYKLQTEDEFKITSGNYIALRYTPNNTMANAIIQDTIKCLGLKANQVVASHDEDSMVKELLHDFAINSWSQTVGGIVLENLYNNNELPEVFRYKLRGSSPAPSELFFGPEDMKYKGQYIRLLQMKMSGVQICLDKSYTNRVSSNSLNPTNKKVSYSIQQMPDLPHYSSERIESIANIILGALTLAAFIVVMNVENKYPANEKFIGINILMMVNGVSNRLNLLSWFISAAIWSTCYLVPIVLVLKFFMRPWNILPYLLYGNAFIVWLALLANVCHLITFGLHLSSYFWKPSHGSSASTMLMVLMSIFANLLTGKSEERLLLYIGILVPNFILKRIFLELTANENKFYGVQWSNLFSCASNDNISEGSVGVMIIFSIIGIIFHLCMVIYIYAVRPGKYGVRQHPLYCFRRMGSSKDDENGSAVNFNDDEPTKEEFEYVEPGSLEPGIRIRNLKKVYTSGCIEQTNVNALQGVSIDIYKRQITALLGHNGAGKTTMMSIISGLTDSTNGVVFIDGENIMNGNDNIKRNVGLCPQENMVFPDLTVYQQLMFFGELRFTSGTQEQLENELRVLLNKVNLTNKINAYPSQLSGGQKRRLCLALAIIGDAKVLILDEPTSGMDAESKREVWDIVLKMRGEKTIIISTHDMEEADILGDRVAIMHTGKLKCYGTSMFLKKLYGDGQVEVTLSIEPWCEITKIFEEINMTAQILDQDDDKIVLALPAAESLPVALDKLENSKKKLGITGMSVSIITLEQVFLRVTKDDVDEQDSHNEIKGYQKVTGFPYYLQTFYGFLLKKIIFARKNPWTFWLSIIYPSLSGLFILLQFGQRANPNEAYSVSLSVYTNSKAFFATDEPLIGEMYRQTIASDGGTARIVNKNTSVTDALLNYGRDSLDSYHRHVIVSAEFNKSTGDNLLANGFYSSTATLSIPIAINSITNAIVKAVTNNTKRVELSMQQILDPNSSAEQNVYGAIMTILLIPFLAAATALYVVQPLTEILFGVKQLQLMTGVPKTIYWAATYFFDLLQYILSILLLLVIYIVVDKMFGLQYFHGTEIGIILVLLILFGISALPLIYLCSFLKRSVNATRTILTIGPLILVTVQIIFYTFTISINNQTFQDFRIVLGRIFMLLPHLSLTFGYATFFTTLEENARCRQMSNSIIEAKCHDSSEDPCCSMSCFDHVCKKPLSYFRNLSFLEAVNIPNLSESMLWLGLSSLLYFLIIFTLEQQLFARLITKLRSKGNHVTDTSTIDEMVKSENAIINEEMIKCKRGHYTEDDNGSILLVQGLRKNYGNLNAVKGINFRVKQSECFGLLGVNGAGKSTTFKMLTGDIIPSGGTVYLKQYSSTMDRTKYLSAMGYCPQQDAIIDTLNAWDHLYLFGRLRGIPQSQLHSIVKYWIKKLNLSPCASQPSGTYSGGNKRRLNIAMALIGNPPLVLMDEPTTGVDPAARRSLWNALKTCQNAGQSIILTSHSMEECEVLCNRLVIMIGGQIVCVGASQQLKQRFGAGYNIHVKLRSIQNENNDVEAIKQRIVSELNCNLIDENTGFLAYHVIDPDATWTTMYTLMDELKNEYGCIEDYAVLSSTLEQLFIQFARSHNSKNNAFNNNGYLSDECSTMNGWGNEKRFVPSV